MKAEALEMRKVGVIIGFLLFACPAVFPQNPRQILQRTGNTYAELKSFHFEGVAQMKVEVDGVRYGMNLPLEMAQGETPGQHLGILFKTPAWEKPIGKDAQDYPPLTGISMPDIQAYDFARIAQRVRSLTFLRHDILEAHGEQIPCFVIRVVSNWSPEPSTLWIDKTTRLVLRVQFRTVVKSEGTQPAHQLNWITTFTSYKLNAALPAWLVNRKGSWDNQVAALKTKMIGTTVTDFKLTYLDGREIRLADFRDRTVLLSFWATWCFPCRRELPVIAKIERDWAAKGLTVLRITNETPEVVRAFLKGTHQKFATLVNGESVSSQFAANGIPTLVLIDKSGRIVTYDVSELSETELLDRLKQAGLEKP